MTEPKSASRTLARRLVAASVTAALVASFAFVGTASAQEPYALFNLQPSGGPANQPWMQQPVVRLWNADPAFRYAASIQIDPIQSTGSGSLSCVDTSVDMLVQSIPGGTFADGAFLGCQISAPGTYVLQAAVTGFALAGFGVLPPIGVFSAPFQITSGGGGIATSIAFTAQPLGANIGGPVPSANSGAVWAIQPAVSLLDSFGGVTTGDSSTVIALQITPGTPQSGGPGSLACSGGNSLTVFRGVAQFTGCRITGPGTGYALTARTVSSGSTLVLSAVSLSFNIGSGNQPSFVGFSVQPLGATPGIVPTATSGQVWPTQPQVTVFNGSGQPVTSDNATVVTLSIGSGSGTFACTSGTSRTVVGGVANFAGCSITGSGSFTLRATATNPSVAGIAPATSLPFSLGQQATGLTLTAAPIPINPGQTSVLTVQFSTGANQPIAIQSKTALSPTFQTVVTLTTDANGRAVYTTLPLTFSTTYQAVFAGGGGLAAATSPAFVVGVRRTVTMAPQWSGNRTVARGTALTFTSKIGPLNGVAVPRGTFQIYQQINGVWTFSTSATFATNSAGDAVFTWTFSRSGLWYVRWRANSDAYNVTAFSPINRVRVP